MLEAILLGLGAEQLIGRDLLTQAERDESWRIRVPEGARIELDVSFDGGPKETWVRTADEHFVRGEDGRIPVPRMGGDLAVEYFSSWRAPSLVGPVKPLIAGRPPGDSESNRLWKLKQRIIDQRSRRAYQRPQFPWAESREEIWLRKLNEVWSRFHKDDGTSIDAQIVDPEAEDLYADLYVMKHERRLCPIDQASSGEIELLCCLGWMILHDFTAGLLLIDEPELHLHPQWQAGVLPALRMLAPKTQIIAASHADAPWDQAFSLQRFLLATQFNPEMFLEDEDSSRSSPPKRPVDMQEDL